MPGSWEILESNKVLCAILHTDVTTIAWSFGLRNLIIPGRDELRMFYPFLPLAGMPYDHARNTSVIATLNSGAEYLFCYDSDVVPPRDAILRLMTHKLPIISGMYCRRSPPHGLPVMIKDGRWITDFTPGSLVEVDVVGAGCLLIHRSVFERLPPDPRRPEKRWFDWRVDCKGLILPNGQPLYQDGECLSEDFVFCQRIKQHLGIKTYVDTSVRCKHIGHCEADLGSLLPSEIRPLY